MLLASDAAVVSLRRLEELEMPVCGEGSAAVAEGLHLRGRHGVKPHATATFWRRIARESMPLIVVATGTLIA